MQFFVQKSDRKVVVLLFYPLFAAFAHVAVFKIMRIALQRFRISFSLLSNSDYIDSQKK